MFIQTNRAYMPTITNTFWIILHTLQITETTKPHPFSAHHNIFHKVNQIPNLYMIFTASKQSNKIETYLSRFWSCSTIVDILFLSSSWRLSTSPKMFLSIFNKKHSYRGFWVFPCFVFVWSYDFEGFKVFYQRHCFSGKKKMRKEKESCALKP